MYDLDRNFKSNIYGQATWNPVERLGDTCLKEYKRFQYGYFPAKMSQILQTFMGESWWKIGLTLF